MMHISLQNVTLNLPLYGANNTHSYKMITCGSLSLYREVRLDNLSITRSALVYEYGF